MFFLGISAHMVIYLLVPAFLVICLYSSGTSDFSETKTLLPNIISHEIRQQAYPEQMFVYSVVELVAENQENDAPFFDFPQEDLVFYLSPNYLSYSFTAISLRAPPMSNVFI